MVRHISLINMDVSLSAVLHVPPSYQFVHAAGGPKKSLVSPTRAKISVSFSILLIPNRKHWKATGKKY